MKLMSIIFCLSLSLSVFAQSMEIHYDATAEKNCRAEVLRVGCGTPTENNQDNFFTCVDQKILKLSETCREMHRTLSDARKETH